MYRAIQADHWSNQIGRSVFYPQAEHIAHMDYQENTANTMQSVSFTRAELLSEIP